MADDYTDAIKKSFGYNDPTIAWNAAIDEAVKIAEEAHDEWDKDNPYCQGMCDAAKGIASRIKGLKQ